VFRIIARLLRRPAVESGSKIVNDPGISRAGIMTRGARPGDTRHRPTAHERDLAGRIGVQVYDSERRQT
jgi:hypothetical protein